MKSVWDIPISPIKPESVSLDNFRIPTKSAHVKRYNLDPEAAAFILSSVMRTTPRPFRQLFTGSIEGVIIEPTVPQDQVMTTVHECVGGKYRLGLDLDNAKTGVTDPNAALGASFMSEVLNRHRANTIGIKGPLIGTLVIGGIAQAPAFILNSVRESGSVVAAASFSGGVFAGWLLRDLLRDTPAIAASDRRVLPIGDWLVSRAAEIGAGAVREPCLVPAVVD